MLKKLYDWACNCWAKPPRPTESLNNNCEGNFGAGQNPLIGLACTEPDVLVLDSVAAVDPPLCYGGVPGLCDPMPTLWRVAFPCKVPGSTCSTPAACDPTEILTSPSGVAPRPVPFADCPGAWTMTISGISGDSPCCSGLNGSFTLCYRPKPSLRGVLTWGTDCLPHGADCSPETYDARRRLWQLEYDEVDQIWTLASLSSIEQPKYTLSDTDPCAGTTKVLTQVSPTGSGCATAPSTVTLTRDSGASCADYVEPGCQILLVRACGETNYAVRGAAVSANPAADTICKPTHGIYSVCCDVGWDYTITDCCAVQKEEYVGTKDPFFDKMGAVDVWSLDLTADPITLTGTFIEGEVVYEVDSNGLQCSGVTHLNLVSTTLDASLLGPYPKFVCMVPDNLLTCNVRLGIDGAEESPRSNAGYDSVTGQDDFCNCYDTCAPTILGSISITGDCGTAVPVCAARQSTIAPQDPAAKTQYPRIACARFFDGTRWNVVTQVFYCVGGDSGHLWASDWYCTTGSASDDPTARTCSPCSVYVGSFKGTTYAEKTECDTLPFFAAPSGGMGDCVCTPTDLCCHSDNVIHVTISSPCVKLNGLVFQLSWQTVTLIYQSEAYTVCGVDAIVTLACNSATGVWTLTITVYRGAGDCLFVATSTDIVCSPHMSGTFTNGTNPNPAICTAFCCASTTFTAVVSL